MNSQIVYGLQVITIPPSMYGRNLLEVVSTLLPDLDVGIINASINGIPVDINGQHPIYDHATVVLSANKLHTLG